MTTLRRISLLAVGLILVTSLCADDVLAQRRGGGSSRGSGGGGGAGPIELSATYGSMWGGNIQLYNGKLRTATAPSWSVALSINLDPAMAVELSYTHQDGKVNYDSRGTLEELSDLSINYWQIGSTRNLMPGKVQPFVLGAIGLTYYVPGASEVELEGETYNMSSSTKLSFAIGLGLKTYFGEAEKVGLRLSLKTMPTLYNTGGGFWFGTGGASLGVTGNAVWQWEVAGGLTVRFGV